MVKKTKKISPQNPLCLSEVELDHPKKRYSWISMAIPIAILLWPFLYLIEYIVPLAGQYTTIGNDFIPYYYKYKVYLLAHLAEGHFPLWSPSEGAGFPFFSSPLTQAFYPFNLPLVLWYKLSGGYNPIDHQVFTIAGLSIFGLGLYCWLRQINSNIRAVLFSVLVMTVSFRLVETLRFPNGIHSAAWYPWILYAMTKIVSTDTAKKTILPCLILIFSACCLCTAGYPYFLYYSLFLFVPYFLLLLIPFSRTALFGLSTIRWKKTIWAAGLSGTIVLLLCAPYLMAIKQLMKTTFNRDGGSYYYSTAHAFTIKDSIGSLIYPPLAQWEGWYFFSITGVLLIGLFLFRCLGGISKKDNSSILPTISSLPKWRISGLILILWIAVCSYISYGKESYLFTLLWHILPGFSSLRVWGRFNIILVPLLAWLLSMAYAMFEAMVFQTQPPYDLSLPKKKKQHFFLFAAFYFVILQTQIVLYLNNLKHAYWDRYAGRFSTFEIAFVLMGAIAFIALFFLLTAGRSFLEYFRKPQWILFSILFLMASAEMWPVGAHPWANREPMRNKRTMIDTATYHRESFLQQRSNKDDTVAFSSVFNVGLPSPNWHFDSYVRFFKGTAPEIKNRNILLGVKGGRRVFFSESLSHPSIYSFLKDGLRFEDAGHLISYNGDILVWEIDVVQDGYLSFIDNWDPYWKVSVNGQEKNIEKLFGTFKSVYLTKGPQHIEFRYEPTLRGVLGINSEPGRK